MKAGELISYSPRVSADMQMCAEGCSPMHMPLLCLDIVNDASFPYFYVFIRKFEDANTELHKLLLYLAPHRKPVVFCEWGTDCLNHRICIYLAVFSDW